MDKTDETQIWKELRSLRKHAGLGRLEIAEYLGLAGASSYQYYEEPEKFRKRYLPQEMTEKLARLLTGRGDPPIQREQVLSLAGMRGETRDDTPEQRSDRRVQVFSDVLTDLAKRTGIEINNAQATILARTLVLAQDKAEREGRNLDEDALEGAAKSLQDFKKF